MINREETGHTEVAFREEEKKETLFYTTEEMFGTRGSMKLRWPPRHILVPLNGEKEGRRIIPYVAALAKTYKAKVTLLTVGRPFQWSLATPSVPAPTTKALESRLIPFVVQLREEGADVDFKILRGEKSKVLKKLVNENDTDLVILANRCRHSWLRYLQGIDFVPNIDRFRVPTFII
ncbi:MAG TPA: universal stress protein [Nitrospinota bacterium]|nr:universal stress protein [Nitrospinota bacterium]